MDKSIEQKEFLSLIFLRLGSEYYATARYSVQFNIMVTPYNLFHHAFEMLIKGYLIKMGYELSELKKFGHKLTKLWSNFKSTTGDEYLSKYDMTISRLNQFENLRYPDRFINERIIINTKLGEPEPIKIPGENSPSQYFANIREFDEIVTMIFSKCSINPIPSHLTVFKNHR